MTEIERKTKYNPVPIETKQKGLQEIFREELNAHMQASFDQAVKEMLIEEFKKNGKHSNSEQS